MDPINRRLFFKRALQISGTVLLAPLTMKLLGSQTAHAAAVSLPLLNIKDPTAKAVGYIEDHTKSPKAKGSNCKNCSFYVKKEDRNGKEVGTCVIFAGKVVYGNAYCNSWNKKA